MTLVKVKILALAVAVAAVFGSGAVLLERPAATAGPTAPAPADPTIEELKRENERLRQRVAFLERQLAVHEKVAALTRAEDPPSDAEVLRALPKGAAEAVAGSAESVAIVKEKVADRLDPPRHYPLIGVAQLRHRHWECRVYYTEAGAKPGQGGAAMVRVQVVYLDQDTLVRAAEVPR
jgi:hypothetical protein